MDVLAATTRNPNNDTTTVHEEIVLDVASSVAGLKRRGVGRRGTRARGEGEVRG